MAVTSTLVRNSVFLKLNAGTLESGAPIIKTVSLGSLKSSTFNSSDNQKVQNIVDALMPCLAYSLYQTQHLVLNIIDEE